MNSKIKRLREIGKFRLDAEKKVLSFQDKPLDIPLKEIELLCVLTENGGELITKDELLNRVWQDSFVEESNLTRHIYRLRKMFAEYGESEEIIQNVPRRGYRFTGKIVHKVFEQTDDEFVFERHQKQQFIIEEITQTNSPELPKLVKSKKLSKFYLPAIALVSVAIVSTFAFWQWKQNAELRSFDALHSVKLTSWKSTRSNDYWDYRSSHSGNMIAYSSTKEGNTSIFVKQINGGEDIRITKDDWNNSSPIWSPDDQQIAFASVREKQAGIYLSPSLGGTANLLKIVGEGNLALRGWSKDGSTIFYESKGNLFKLNIASKDIEAITNFEPDEAEERFFSVSPNEDKVAFDEKNDGQTDIWLLEIPGGNKKRLTNDVDVENGISWHSDNNRLFYSVYRNNNEQINLAYADGREPVQVTRGDSDPELMNLSPDGTKLFYYNSEDKSDIGGINLDTGEEFEVANETESEFWADASPDGKSIAYLSNSTHHAIKQLTDSTVIVRPSADKTRLMSFKGLNQKWLPDNNRIAFLRWEAANQRYNLWTFSTFDGEEKQISNDGITPPGTASFPYNRTQTRDFSWSNDSQKVVYAGKQRQNILLTSIETGATINLTNNADPNLTFHCPLWSNDGKQIAYVSSLKPATPNEKLKWSVHLFENGESKEIFATTESLRFLGWANNNRELLFESTAGAMKSDPSDIKLLQISLSGESKTINSFEKISALSLALSPDGKNVVFTKEIDGKDNVYLTAIDKNDVKKLTNNADSYLFFGSLAWSAANKSVYFDKQQRINTISMFENFR